MRYPVTPSGVYIGRIAPDGLLARNGTLEEYDKVVGPCPDWPLVAARPGVCIVLSGTGRDNRR